MEMGPATGCRREAPGVALAPMPLALDLGEEERPAATAHLSAERVQLVVEAHETGTEE